jgi:hypothetical protein
MLDLSGSQLLQAPTTCSAFPATANWTDGKKQMSLPMSISRIRLVADLPLSLLFDFVMAIQAEPRRIRSATE